MKHDFHDLRLRAVIGYAPLGDHLFDLLQAELAPLLSAENWRIERHPGWFRLLEADGRVRLCLACRQRGEQADLLEVGDDRCWQSADLSTAQHLVDLAECEAGFNAAKAAIVAHVPYLMSIKAPRMSQNLYHAMRALKPA